MPRSSQLILLLALCACGSEKDPQPQTLEERLAAQPGFWFEAREGEDLAAELQQLAALGYAEGYEPAAGGERGVVVHDPQRAQPGWNLYSSGHDSAAYLLAPDGALVHEWSYPFERLTGVPGMEHSSQDAWRRVHLLEDGSLLALHEGLCLLKVDRDSRLQWVFGGFPHHDIEVLPDGRIFTLTRRPRLLPRLNPRTPILVDSIAELTADGELVREVSVVECLRSSRWHAKLSQAAMRGGDCLHTNSLRVLDGSLEHEHPSFRAGNVLVCVRELDAVGVIDLEQQRFVWWQEGAWRAPHDPHLLPGGRLLIFDNMGSEGYSRALEVDLTTGATVWSFGGDPPSAFFSVFCGALTRLPAGNTLVTESCNGRAFEVTPAGQVVWAFHSPHRAGEDAALVAALFEVERIPGPLAWLVR